MCRLVLHPAGERKEGRKGRREGGFLEVFNLEAGLEERPPKLSVFFFMFFGVFACVRLMGREGGRDGGGWLRWQ